MAQIFVPQIYTQGIGAQPTSGGYIRPSTGVNTAQGTSTGGAGLPPTNIFGNFTDGSSSTGILGDIKSGISGIKNGITSGINSFGTNFGFAPAANYYAMGPNVLPWQQAGMVANPTVAAKGLAGATTGTTLSGTLSAAGIGSFVGGLTGKLFGGNGGMGANVGGAIGGAIGNALLPGAGGWLGGALGGALGGLFGGKPKAQVSIFSNSTDDMGNMGKPAFGTKTLGNDPAQQTFNAVQPYVQGLASILGPLKVVNIVGGTHSKWGGNFIAAVPGDQMTESENVPKEFINNFKDDATFGQAVDKTLRSIAKYSGYSDAEIDSAMQKLQQKAAIGASPNTPQIMIQPPTEDKSFQQFVDNYKARMNAPATAPNAAK